MLNGAGRVGEIGVNATRCFNLGGVDYRGTRFSQSTTLLAGGVGALVSVCFALFLRVVLGAGVLLSQLKLIPV